MARRHHMVSSLALVVKGGNAAAEREAEDVARWLTARGVPHHLFTTTGDVGALEIPQVDLVLALSGDGTIVALARHLLGRHIPLAGVNFGRVGFLAELSPQSWAEGLERMLEHGLMVESRMTLAYVLRRDNQVLYQGEVINDVVVTRGRLARLVHLELELDHAPFMVLRSDGIILSTPTGSTGYAGSAGGPIVLPGINAYVVAAICPFLSSFPPLMLGAESLFSIRVDASGTDLHLSLDGQATYELQPGDCLEVQGYADRFLLADMGMNSYFQRLQAVGLIQQER